MKDTDANDQEYMNEESSPTVHADNFILVLLSLAAGCLAVAFFMSTCIWTPFGTGTEFRSDL